MSYLEIAKDLIRFRTTEDNPQAIQDCVSYVSDLLKKSGIDFEIHAGKNKGIVKPSIMAYLDDDPSVILAGHLDVMPAYDGMFSPQIKNDIMYARGSCDMKTQDAVFLSLMKAYANQKTRPSLGLMFTTDEEIGGEGGGRYLIHDKGYRCDFAIAGEPTGLDVAVKEKGVLQFLLRAEGQEAHAAVSHEGTSANKLLREQIQILEKKYGKTTPHNFWTTSFNEGDFRTIGGKVNMVPAKAEAKIDIRYVNPKQHDQILANVIGFSQNEVILDVSMMKTDPNNPFVKKLEQARKEVTGEPSTKDHSKVYSDGRFFTEVGIPVVSFGPFGGNPHAPGEYVDLKSVEQYETILKKFLDDLNE